MNPSFRPLWKRTAVASASVATITLLSATMASAALTPVDLELFLSMDVSGSVDAAEFDLQKQGYVQAFQDAAIHAAIASKPNGVAVALGQWGAVANTPILGWSLLKTGADADAFATAITGITRLSTGNTCVSCGINAAVAEIQGNDYIGKSIIDVSGDGRDNVAGTAATAAARDAAAALNIRINGLPILGQADLLNWYTTNVKTADGFIMPAADFAAFNEAVKLKIRKEIVDEVPAPLPILGAGMALGFSRRLRKRINIATLA
jgi:hypothetical protein